MIPVEFDQSAFIFLIIWSFVVGVFLGAVYDIFRIRRISFSPEIRSKTRILKDDVCPKHGTSKLRGFFRKNIEIIDLVLIFFEDVIFMVFSAIVISLLTYKFNSGKIRWFILASAAIGFTCYYLTIGRLVKRCAEKIIRAIRLVVWWIIKITIIPAIKLLLALYNKASVKLLYIRLVRYTKNRERALLYLACGKDAFDKMQKEEATISS